MNIYTVYRNPNAKSEEDALVLVPEGFSWWGFFFPLNIIWALGHRSWLFALISLSLFAIYVIAAFQPIPYAEYVNITKLPAQLFLGIFMYDFYRLSLRRRGYEFIDITSGKNDTEALRNYLASKY